MVFSNVIVDFTISPRSFVFGQSRVKVSAGFTNVSSLAVAVFDLVYCSLSVLWFVFVLDIRTIKLNVLLKYYIFTLLFIKGDGSMKQISRSWWLEWCV